MFKFKLLEISTVNFPNKQIYMEILLFCQYCRIYTSFQATNMNFFIKLRIVLKLKVHIQMTNLRIAIVKYSDN